MKQQFRVSRTLSLHLLAAEGQNLVEYLLLIALLAFGLTAAMSSIAQSVNTALINVSTTLTSAN